MDALDAHLYDEHHESGQCYLSLSKVSLSTKVSEFYWQFNFGTYFGFFIELSDHLHVDGTYPARS